MLVILCRTKTTHQSDMRYMRRKDAQKQFSYMTYCPSGGGEGGMGVGVGDGGIGLVCPAEPKPLFKTQRG